MDCYRATGLLGAVRCEFAFGREDGFVAGILLLLNYCF